MQHLCIRTLRPSHTESFEERYLSSQEDFLAKDFHKQVSKKVSMIQYTSSHTSQKESESASQQLCFSKMYLESSVATQTTENQFSNMSSEHWKKWVTEQRQEYSQRKKLAHHTKESESSSLGWPTPTAVNRVRNEETMEKCLKFRQSNGQTSVPLYLEETVLKEVKKEVNWPTARTSDAEGGRIETQMTNEGFKSKRHKSNQTFGAKLRDAVETHEEKKNWATPQVMDIRTDVRKPEERSDKANKGGCKNLREQVHYPDINHSRKTSRGELGHPDQVKPSTNGKSQGSQGKLNPNWVEHLMGLPVGWTQL